MRPLGPSFRIPRINLNVIPLLIALLVMPLLLEAQDATEDVASEEISKPVERSVNRIRLQEFEGILVGSLRHQFRASGVFTTVQSCRLPDYGPVITVTIQPPPYYFTRPVLQELERRQKIAEQQAQKIREQFDRTAQIVKLKAKEADLLEQIRNENSKNKGKADTSGLQQNLQETRKTLKELESAAPVETVSMPSADNVTEVDLNKMIMENYQDLVDKLTSTMKTVLAENAAALMADGDNRICISTTIRDNFLGNQEKTMLFVLTDPDVKAFRNGTVDLNTLKDKVLVTYTTEE
jgi:hypothetical protein